MQPIYQHTSETVPIEKQEKTLQFHQIDFECLPKKQAGRKNVFIKRISPFLLFAVCLPAMFLYMLITDEIWQNGFYGMLFLFLFLEVNILFLDFAIWNYTGGKKKIGIWITEIVFLAPVIYFLS